MNYDHVHMTYEFWETVLRPNVRQLIQLQTFDSYLKEFSLTKSGRWLRNAVNVKLLRPPLAVDPEQFLKEYKDKCVLFHPPGRPEDGMGRAIYQLSPTFHLEVSFWAWIETNKLHSYVSIFVCYTDEEELSEFLKKVKPMCRTGNTEDRNGGFNVGGGLFQPPQR